MSLRLVRPSSRYKHSYIAALKEYLKESAHRHLIKHEIENFAYHLEHWNRSSRHNCVTYWLVDGNEYVGMTQIRRQPQGLLPKLKSHIYYDIRPSKRRLGYGTRILKLALKKARQLGLRSVIIVCKKGNIASRRIIEINGGILKNAITVKGHRAPFLRYCVGLT